MPQTVAIEVSDFNQKLFDLAVENVNGRNLNMDQLRELLGGKSVLWIKNNILYNLDYQDEIQEMISNHQITEANGKGTRWYFKATAMTKFIEKHYEELPWGK